MDVGAVSDDDLVEQLFWTLTTWSGDLTSVRQEGGWLLTASKALEADRRTSARARARKG